MTTPTATAPPPSPDTLLLKLVVLVAVLAIGVMIVAARRHGIWIDEIWSFWMSRRDIPLRQLISDGWLKDVHPPLFPALNTLLSPLMGDSIFARRLVNLAPLAYLIASAAVVARREPAQRAFVLIFFLLIVTSQKSLTYFPEFRSYFAVLCLTASLALWMLPTFTSGRDFDARQDRAVAAGLAITILISLNIHYISSVAVGSFLFATALGHLIHRRFKWAAVIVVSTIVAIAPLVAVFALQLPFAAAISTGFWIDTTPKHAIVMLAQVVVHTVFDNPVIGLAFVAVALASFMGRAGRSPPNLLRRFAAPLSGGRWSFAVATFSAVALASTALVAVSFVKPVLSDRYLTAMVSLAAAMAAAVAADWIAARRPVILLCCAMALVLTAIYSLGPMRDVRWNATTNYLQHGVAACPTAIVYAIDPRFREPYNGPPNQPEIQDWGYQLVGRAHGFEVRIRDSRDSTPLELSQACPTYLWAEHSGATKWLLPLENSAFLRTPALQAKVRAAKVFKGPSGFVIELAPDRAIAPADAGR